MSNYNVYIVQPLMQKSVVRTSHFCTKQLWGKITDTHSVYERIVNKINEIWQFFIDECTYFMRNLADYQEFDEHIEMLNEWMLEEGHEMKVVHEKIDLFKLKSSRETDVLDSLENFLFFLKQKKQYFLENRNVSYFDWLYEAPYSLEEKLLAYEILNDAKENVYEFSPVVHTHSNYKRQYDQNLVQHFKGEAYCF